MGLAELREPGGTKMQQINIIFQQNATRIINAESALKISKSADARSGAARGGKYCRMTPELVHPERAGTYPITLVLARKAPRLTGENTVA